MGKRNEIIGNLERVADMISIYIFIYLFIQWFQIIDMDCDCHGGPEGDVCS